MSEKFKPGIPYEGVLNCDDDYRERRCFGPFGTIKEMRLLISFPDGRTAGIYFGDDDSPMWRARAMEFLEMIFLDRAEEFVLRDGNGNAETLDWAGICGRNVSVIFKGDGETVHEVHLAK